MMIMECPGKVCEFHGLIKVATLIIDDLNDSYM